jgi:hypothetical protein
MAEKDLEQLWERIPDLTELAEFALREIEYRQAVLRGYEQRAREILTMLEGFRTELKA